MQLAAARLTPYLGPIAKVLVKKAAQHARDTAQLYNALADHITDAEDKARFLQDVTRKKK